MKKRKEKGIYKSGREISSYEEDQFKDKNLWRERYYSYLIFPWDVGDKPR